MNGYAHDHMKSRTNIEDVLHHLRSTMRCQPTKDEICPQPPILYVIIDAGEFDAGEFVAFNAYCTKHANLATAFVSVLAAMRGEN